MNARVQDGEEPVEHIVPGLRSQRGREVHRPLDIREHDGDLLTLPLQSVFGIQDLVGQMLGRVIARATSFAGGHGGVESLSALPAKAGSSLTLPCAMAAGPFQRAAAGLAEK